MKYLIRDKLTNTFVHKNAALSFPRMTNDRSVAMSFDSEQQCHRAISNMPAQIIAEVFPVECETEGIQ